MSADRRARSLCCATAAAANAARVRPPRACVVPHPPCVHASSSLWGGIQVACPSSTHTAYEAAWPLIQPPSCSQAAQHWEPPSTPAHRLHPTNHNPPCSPRSRTPPSLLLTRYLRCASAGWLLAAGPVSAAAGPSPAPATATAASLSLWPAAKHAWWRACRSWQAKLLLRSSLRPLAPAASAVPAAASWSRGLCKAATSSAAETSSTSMAAAAALAAPCCCCCCCLSGGSDSGRPRHRHTLGSSQQQVRATQQPTAGAGNAAARKAGVDTNAVTVTVAGAAHTTQVGKTAYDMHMSAQGGAAASAAQPKTVAPCCSRRQCTVATWR
jgi:hypothetical protein